MPCAFIAGSVVLTSSILSMIVGGREAGHTSPLTGGEVSLRDRRSHGAQTQCNAKYCAGVSRSAHLVHHLTAGACQPLHWPGVPCGSLSGRVLVFVLNARLARVVRCAGEPQRPRAYPMPVMFPAIGPGRVGGAGYGFAVSALRLA